MLGSNSSESHIKVRFITGLRVVLGLILFVGGVAKIFSPTASTNLLSMVLGLSKDSAFMATCFLICFEIASGALLMLDRLVPLLTFGATLMFSSSIILGIQLMSAPVDCGCFGDLLSSKTDVSFVVRNTVLLLLSMAVLSSYVSAGGRESAS